MTPISHSCFHIGTHSLSFMIGTIEGIKISNRAIPRSETISYGRNISRFNCLILILQPVVIDTNLLTLLSLSLMFNVNDLLGEVLDVAVG